MYAFPSVLTAPFEAATVGSLRVDWRTHNRLESPIERKKFLSPAWVKRLKEGGGLKAAAMWEDRSGRLSRRRGGRVVFAEGHSREVLPALGEGQRAALRTGLARKRERWRRTARAAR